MKINGKLNLWSLSAWYLNLFAYNGTLGWWIGRYPKHHVIVFSKAIRSLITADITEDNHHHNLADLGTGKRHSFGLPTNT